MSEEKDDHPVDGHDDDKQNVRPKTTAGKRLEWLGENSKHIWRISLVVGGAGWLVIHYLFPHWEFLIPIIIAVPGIAVLISDARSFWRDLTYPVLSAGFTPYLFLMLFSVCAFAFIGHLGLLTLPEKNPIPPTARQLFLRFIWLFVGIVYLYMAALASYCRTRFLEDAIGKAKKQMDCQFVKSAIHILNLYRHVRYIEQVARLDVQPPGRLDVEDYFPEEVPKLIGCLRDQNTDEQFAYLWAMNVLSPKRQ